MSPKVWLWVEIRVEFPLLDAVSATAGQGQAEKKHSAQKNPVCLLSKEQQSNWWLKMKVHYYEICSGLCFVLLALHMALSSARKHDWAVTSNLFASL